MKNKEEYIKMLKEIDDIKLVSDEELKNMNFYELAYYLQTLNQISSLENILNENGEK